MQDGRLPSESHKTDMEPPEQEVEDKLARRELLLHQRPETQSATHLDLLLSIQLNTDN